MEIFIVISLAMGMAAGVAIGILLQKVTTRELATRLEMLEQEKKRSQNELALLDNKVERAHAELQLLQQDNASLRSDIALRNQRLADSSHSQEEERRQHEARVKELKDEAEQERLRLDEQHTKAMEQAKADFDSQKQDYMADVKTQIENAETAHKRLLEAQEKRHNEAIAAMKGRFDETVSHLTDQLKSVTEDMLKQRQKEFSESSHTQLGQIVTPLRETIDRMKKAMDENSHLQTAMSSEMKANITHMMNQSEAARKSAEELTRVFKHGTKIQGDWGETILDEILTAQGLVKGVHYDTQVVIRDANGNVVKSADGSTMRPDVIVHLDQRRELIVDSKVSLTAFINMVNAETEEERQQHLAAHVESIRRHVKELSAKDYSSYIQAPKVKMDYVIMFVPHTGAMWTALNAQPDLWRRAMEMNVFIADEQTLFAAMRIVHLTWTQIAQAQNHEKVFALADEILDRVGQFGKRYEAMGKALEKAQEAYMEGRRKLAPNGQSIVTSANKLKKLGARQSDKNPLPNFVDVDDIPALPADGDTSESSQS